MNTYIFLTTGFEEIEAVTTVDILRRAEINCKMVSLIEDKTVVGAHQIPVITDLMFSEVNFSEADMLILPGGTIKINEHEDLKKEIKSMLKKNKKIAAICAAPMVLGTMGLLKGKKASCYPGFEKYLDGAIIENSPVVVDGNIITGRGPGFTINFALKIIEELKGVEAKSKVARGLLVE